MGIEGSPTGWVTLLPLQQPGTFYLQVPLGEDIKDNYPFKPKGGDGTREGSLDPSGEGGQAKGTPGGDAQGVGHHIQTPFLNPDPFHWRYGIENVVKVRINGVNCMALLDNGAEINTITPDFIESCSLEVGPLSDLVGRWVACVGLGNALTWPVGYVVIWIQVDGVQGYDEDQIALVIPDLSNFVAWVPVIFGTATISHIINVIKEKEIDALAMPWVNAQVAYLITVWWAIATIEDSTAVAGKSNPSEYDEVVTTKDTKTIDAFSSLVIHARMRTTYTGEGINVMTQALHAEDGSLPQGLMVQNVYTELCSGSKNVAVLVRNSTAYPQTLMKKTPVVRAVTVTQLPDPPVQTSLTEASEEAHSHWMPTLNVKQRQEKLFEELELSGLEFWPPRLVASTQSLLAEYHDIFSLEPSEPGCTHSIEHVIKVTNDTPFKEWFRQIPLPLVEEVHMHLWDMLDSDAIHPSQSAWCNAVVLVRKKDGGLHFCKDFWRLNAHTKKDFYPLPRIQEALESLAGAGHFSYLDLKSRFMQTKMDESSKQYTVFTIGNLCFFKCDYLPFGLCNAPATFQQLMQNCLGELNLIYCLIYLNDIVVFLHTVEEHLYWLHIIFDQFREHNLKLKPSKCNFFKEEITYLAHWVQPSNSNLKAIAESALPQTYTEVCAFLGLVGHYRRFIKGLNVLHSHLMNIYLER